MRRILSAKEYARALQSLSFDEVLQASAVYVRAAEELMAQDGLTGGNEFAKAAPAPAKAAAEPAKAVSEPAKAASQPASSYSSYSSWGGAAAAAAPAGEEEEKI